MASWLIKNIWSVSVKFIQFQFIVFILFYLSLNLILSTWLIIKTFKIKKLSIEYQYLKGYEAGFIKAESTEGLFAKL